MTDSHPFKLIVFDVDGTLVDSQAGIIGAMTHAFDSLALPAPSAEAVRRVVGLSLEEAIARLVPAASDPALVARVAAVYRREFVAMRQRSDYDEPLFPGAREAVAGLDVPRVCLGVATGKNLRGLRATLARHKLDRHFVTLQTADGGPGKPHPRMLHDAMTETGAAPHETVLIGDTVFDMAMAANAGTPALGVAWGYHDAAELSAAGARRVLTTFEELPRILGAWGEVTSCDA